MIFLEPFVLDNNLNRLMLLDTYESLLWTERYSSYGDFEVYTYPTEELVSNLKEGYFLSLNDSEQTMIIEDIEVTSDVESGDHLIVTGRSLESLLDRRIVWVQTVLDGYLQGQVKKLLEQNLISPTDEKRKIPRFVFKESTDERITSLKISAQFTGDNLYDAIKSICDSFNLGFKVTLSENNEFVFELYLGEDRSYDQTKNPYVVFSPSFDNLINSNYLSSKRALKTVTLVAGEEQGTNRRTTTVYASNEEGINRRELYTDARDISSTIEGGTLTDAEYISQLEQRGKEKLAENVEIKSFEGQAETKAMFIYGVDFFKGDIVQTSNGYGMEYRSRITEIVRSNSSEGYDIYPTFEIVQEKIA